MGFLGFPAVLSSCTSTVGLETAAQRRQSSGALYPIAMYVTACFLIFCDLHAQSPCVTRNFAFAAGEELHYPVNYNWGMIWLESAEATFRVADAEMNRKKCYLLSGSGKTFPKYDWFFKVNDLFETYLDSASFRPLKFSAKINEGPKHDDHLYLFENNRHRVFTIINRGRKKVELDTVPIGPCSIDVLTAIYYARNIDYSRCQPHDTIGVSILLDGKLFPLYVRYLGKEDFFSEELGWYHCIKFRPLLVEGSIFRKGEHMTVWVSNDENKIPLYIETAIIVGSVKVSLMRVKGLRHPETARFKKTAG
jgi:hypothetical protein